MNTVALLLGWSSGLIFIPVLALLVMLALVFYALRSKGDVRAEFTYGKSRFRLDAKAKIEKIHFLD